MLDEIQNTGVITDSSPVGDASSSDAAGSSTSEESQATAPGGDTAQLESQLDTQGNETKQGESAGSAPDELDGVPSLDELEQNINQPYAKALKQLRTAYEARKQEVTDLRGKYDPLNPIVEKLGDIESVQSRLELYDSLFTPVVNPETNQPEYNEFGLARLNPAPFIEKLDAENPGIAEDLLYGALNHAVDYNGQKVPLYKTPEIQTALLKAWGLDPTRLGDYQNIDALSANPTAVTDEELERVPEEFHEAYKQLPPGVRNDLQQQDDETRRFNLEAHKERFDRKAQETQRQQAEIQARQQQESQVRAHVEREQESFVSQHLQESYRSIMDGLASQVSFPEEAAPAIQSTIGALLFSLRDPDFRQANQAHLESLGIKLGSDFDEELARADKHLRETKAYELFNQKGMAQKSLGEARNAKNAVMARLAPLALKVAKAMGGTLKQRAEENGKLLAGATNVRPVPGNGNGVETVDGLPDLGMLPTDPGYGVALFKYLQAQRGG